MRMANVNEDFDFSQQLLHSQDWCRSVHQTTVVLDRDQIKLKMK